MNIIDIQKRVMPQVIELLKKEPESISSIVKATKGWTVLCDVLERKAVPETFDLLKVFEFSLDEEAKVTGFRLLKKIRRGDRGDID